jgi:hypothetical protein
MISKQQFLDSCLSEIRIIKHLYEKVTPKMLAFRPSKKQRSMLELLQYLANFAKVEAAAVYRGKAVNFPVAMKEAYQMPAEKFPAVMDEQAEELKNIFSKITDAELAQEVDLFGREHGQSRALWFLNLILKSLAAYKMQLFLYLKSCGVADIGTSNLWRGETILNPNLILNAYLTAY